MKRGMQGAPTDVLAQVEAQKDWKNLLFSIVDWYNPALDAVK